MTFLAVDDSEDGFLSWARHVLFGQHLQRPQSFQRCRVLQDDRHHRVHLEATQKFIVTAHDRNRIYYSSFNFFIEGTKVILELSHFSIRNLNL